MKSLNRNLTRNGCFATSTNAVEIQRAWTTRVGNTTFKVIDFILKTETLPVCCRRNMTIQIFCTMTVIASYFLLNQHLSQLFDRHI